MTHVAFFVGTTTISYSTEVEKKLFFSSTTDNLDRAVMAVGISNKALSIKKMLIQHIK